LATTFVSENDHGHLIARSGTNVGDPAVPTWADKGFLAWDPAGVKSPVGEADPSAIGSQLATMITGAGEVGCGYEAQLESWYRFLIDPDPYESIVLENNSAVLQGTDVVLLQQRRDFLRPDSVVMVLMVSDENDCSIQDGSQYYFAAQIYVPGTTNPYHLPKPRAACATDPNSDCCRSCGQPPGDGCDDSQDDCSGSLSALDDSINLRCFDQKRRFGIDFNQPVGRYVEGISEAQISDRHGNVVENPLFSDLDRNDDVRAARDRTMVYLAAIVGVPWQDIARRDAAGNPDLFNGLDQNGNPAGGVMSGAEMAASGNWDLVLGDPNSLKPPTDPLMIESSDPRSGINPITGAALAPPGAGYYANPINGHEYSIPARDDLQYACIFPIPVPRDCTEPGVGHCDCNDANNDDPLCQAPDGSFGQIQYAAKAYPGRRHLSVLKAVGEQGIVGSICPPQTNTPLGDDYGYRVMFDAMAGAAAKSLLP
jgi:hypothetical protein